ncbi:hypothetical protein F4780DRAFT_737510 [Xylariomycetidae sp. FL0641]|nr:hypothetical protein F4780DRAFT_737510 [Xylariomycetidae sp. FL0641]
MAATTGWLTYMPVTQVRVPCAINFTFTYLYLCVVWMCFEWLPLWARLAIETTLAVLWIPPVCYVAKLVAFPDVDHVFDAGFSGIALVVFAMMLLLRLSNAAGFALMLGRYDVRAFSYPGTPKFRRAVHVCLSLLVYWAYPALP